MLLMHDRKFDPYYSMFQNELRQAFWSIYSMLYHFERNDGCGRMAF